MCPHALQFDSSDETHLDFVVAATNLIADVCDIARVTDPRHEILRQLDQITLVEMEPDERSNVETRPLKLNLEDETNSQLDYVVAAAHLKADNYSIERVERSEILRIAGGITPALITTAAMTAGLMCLEVYKLAQGHGTIECFRNTFVNMALPVIMFHAPSPPRQYKVRMHSFKTIQNSSSLFN